MSAIQTLKSVFNGGELSPMLDARVDSEKYASGCRELTNFIPSVYGGIKKRPGTELLGFTKNDGPARLHSFKRSTDTNYILEFGNQYVRFWKGGEVPKRVSLVSDPGIPAWIGAASAAPPWDYIPYMVGQSVTHVGLVYVCIQGHYFGEHTEPGVGAEWTDFWAVWDLVGEPSSPWVTTGGNYSVGAKVTHLDRLFRCISSHAPSSLTQPGVGTQWTSRWAELPRYVVGQLVKNGGSYYQCVKQHFPGATFAGNAAYWLPLAESDEIGLTPYQVTTPYSAEEVFDLQFTQLNDVLFIAHPNHPPKRLTRRGETDWLLEDVPFQYAPALDVNEDRTSVQVQFDEVPAFILPWAINTYYDIGDRVTGPTTASGRFFVCKANHDSGSAT